jgi:hypothetical protein
MTNLVIYYHHLSYPIISSSPKPIAKLGFIEDPSKPEKRLKKTESLHIHDMLTALTSHFVKLIAGHCQL